MRPTDGAKSLPNVVRSQLDLHAAYGGVVPEIAARAHVELLDAAINQALAEAGLGFDAIDAVAATAGPGLIGGLIVGVTTGKAIALGLGRPFIAVNHLEAHALTPGLTDGLDFPYLLLLVSGGHTQLLIVKDVGSYERLGTTLDDALGEAFDKAAKLLGLRLSRRTRGRAPGVARAPDHPAAAAHARPDRAAFLARRPQDRAQARGGGARAAQRAGRCRSLRELPGGGGRYRRRPDGARASRFIEERLGTGRNASLVVAGGVAANQRLKAALETVSRAHGFRLVVPPPALCTDNAAMIAWAGAMRLSRGLTDDLAAPVRARWPLDPDAPPALGAGVKA